MLVLLQAALAVSLFTMTTVPLTRLPSPLPRRTPGGNAARYVQHPVPGLSGASNSAAAADLRREVDAAAVTTC